MLTEFLWCWWQLLPWSSRIDNGDFMMMTDLRYLKIGNSIDWLFDTIVTFFNVKNQPPTFQTVTVVLVTSWFSSYSCHLHISSPISVTNIDVSQSSIFHWISNLHYDQKENNLNFKISNTVWMQLTVRLLLWIVNLHYRHLLSDK